MFTERTSVGLDVHARSVAAAAIDGDAGELFRAGLTPSHDQVRDGVRGVPSSAAVTYEAAPTGFGVYRSLRAVGIRIEATAGGRGVVAPS